MAVLIRTSQLNQTQAETYYTDKCKTHVNLASFPKALPTNFAALSQLINTDDITECQSAEIIFF